MRKLTNKPFKDVTLTRRIRGDYATQLRIEGYEPDIKKALRSSIVRAGATVRSLLDEWRVQYNNDRIHGGLNWMTPAAFAASLSGPPVGASPLPPAQTIHQPILS